MTIKTSVQTPQLGLRRTCSEIASCISVPNRLDGDFSVSSMYSLRFSVNGNQCSSHHRRQIIIESALIWARARVSRSNWKSGSSTHHIWFQKDGSEVANHHKATNRMNTTIIGVNLFDAPKALEKGRFWKAIRNRIWFNLRSWWVHFFDILELLIQNEYAYLRL